MKRLLSILIGTVFFVMCLPSFQAEARTIKRNVDKLDVHDISTGYKSLRPIDKIIIKAAPGITWLRIAAHTGFSGNPPEKWYSIFNFIVWPLNLNVRQHK